MAAETTAPAIQIAGIVILIITIVLVAVLVMRHSKKAENIIRSAKEQEQINRDKFMS